MQKKDNPLELRTKAAETVVETLLDRVAATAVFGRVDDAAGGKRPLYRLKLAPRTIRVFLCWISHAFLELSRAKHIFRPAETEKFLANVFEILCLDRSLYHSPRKGMEYVAGLLRVTRIMSIFTLRKMHPDVWSPIAERYLRSPFQEDSRRAAGGEAVMSHP